MPRAEGGPIARVRASGASQGWLGGAPVLAALSGGSDSMAMLCLLRLCCGGEVAAAHLEHGFRGEASLADADFVREYCAREGIRCFVRHEDVRGTRERGESDEMAGRRARYRFFDEIADAHGFAFIATGHTADDSVETMLFNLFRGTGIRGLAGISGRRGRIVRPVIGCRREELRDFLRERGVPWREDATNAEPDYSRNRIRAELLPWARANINPEAERALLGLAAECAETASELEADGEAAAREIAAPRGGALAAWDIRAARRLPPARLLRAIRAQGRELGLPVLDRARTEALAELIMRSGRWRFQWAGDIEAEAASGEVIWRSRPRVGPAP